MSDMELESQPAEHSTLVWTMEDLNREANLFLSDISKCLDKHAKPLITRVNLRPLMWWDKECGRLGYRMKTIR